MHFDLIDSIIVEPLPRLHDVVTSQGLEPFEQRPGVVTCVYRQPHIEQGDRYRVEYRDGSTEWYGAHELTVITDAFSRVDLIADLTSVRVLLFQAITNAGRHDVLNAKLSALFDQLTATARTYLGTDLDHGPDHPGDTNADNQSQPEHPTAEEGDQA
ncbi:hypothetical protein [Actinoplanes siamensis]|uniref:Uncharacterized protein n=1 Tax=Actinoplanes siamensis TaxID=1223317 RepID=A0A919TJS2_9ACTN|nr:hypothetical protein [Actinoplanes siamensis]GIF04659.1 hypothetical protein Asi03nite_21970 [Actinoplanes siamensis]